MSKIKLNAASGGGSVSFEAPASISSDKVLKFSSTPGVIVQVVQTIKTDVFTTNTEDSWVDVTGMSVNITPSSTSSKVLISLQSGVSNGSEVLHICRILRDSTAIGVDTFASSVNGSAIYDAESDDTSARNRAIGHMKVEILDSPSTTSQITYKMQLYKNADGNMHVHRRGFNTSVGETSTFTAYEVAG